MPKITTNIQDSKYNPFAAEDALLGAPKQHVDPYKGTRTEQSLEGYGSFVPEEGYSLLGDSNFAKGVIQERLAADQTGMELAGKFLANTLITAGTELAKTPGYLGGAVLAVGDKIGEGLGMGEAGNSMDYFVNNAWVNAFESLSEEAKAAIPVHISKAVQEGTLWDNMKSGQFWASEGADALGFLLSMMIPGRVIASLGAGAGIANLAKSIGASNKTLGKLLSKSPLLTEVGSTLDEAATLTSRSIKGSNAANHAAAATMNTFIESAAEGGNTYDNVYKTKIAEGLSEEEAKKAAGDAAGTVFAANLPLLMVSNLLEEAWLWKSFNTSGQRKFTNQVLQDLLGQGKLNTNIVKKGFRDGLKTGSGNLAKNFAKEGLLEEGLQSRIQDSAQEDESIINAFNPIDYFNDLMTNVDLQKAVFLGGVMGGGMSVIQTYNDINNYNKQMFGTEEYKAKNWFEKLLGKDTMKQPGLKNIVSEGFINSYKTLEDYAMKDDQGNILRDEKGRIRMDEPAFAKMAEDKARVVDLHRKYDLAVLEGDTFSQNLYGNQIAYNSMLPFLEQDGGLEAFKQYAGEQLTEAWAKQYEVVAGKPATDAQKKEYNTKLVETAEKMQKVYTEVQDTHIPEKYVNYDKEDKPLFNEWKQQLFNQKVNLLLQEQSIRDTQDWFKEERIKRGVDENIDIVGEIIKEKVLDESDPANFDPNVVIKLFEYEHIAKNFPKYKKEIQQNYLDLFNKEGLTKSWNEFKAEDARKREDLKKTVEKDVQEAKDNAKDAEFTNKKFFEDIVAGGYATEGFKDPKSGKDRVKLKELVIAKDKDGKQYRIQTTTDRTTGEVNSYAIDSKGKRHPLTSKFIKDNQLKVVSKAEIEAERQAFRIDSRHQSMLRVMDDIIELKEKQISEYTQSIEESNKKLEELTKSLAQVEKEVNKYRAELKSGKFKSRKAVKRNLSNFKNLYKQIGEQIKNLETERQRLVDLKEKYTQFINEYYLLKEELQKNKNLSFNQEKNRIEKSIYTLIDRLGKDVNLEDNIVATQKSIELIDEQIVEIDRLLEHFYSVRTIMKDIIDQNQFTKQLIITAAYNGSEALNRLEELLDLHPSLRNVYDFVKQRLEAGENLSDILEYNSFKRRIDQAFKKAKTALQEAGMTPQEVSLYLKDNLHSIERAKNQVQDYLGNITYDDFFKMENELEIVEGEIERLSKQFNQLNTERSVQLLHKRNMALEAITKDKVEARFNQYLAEARNAELDATQQQPYGSAEPTSDPEALVHEAALNSELSVHLFNTTGRNMQWNKTENKDDLHTEGELKGLPVQNESVYQQNWFNTLDEIASTNTLDQYDLQLYVPKYDDSSELEQQIGLNNPASRGESDVVAILINKKTGEPVKMKDKFVFTSIWKPETLYASDKPRLAPNAIFENYLTAIKVGDKKYKVNSDKDNTIWSKSDQDKIRAKLGIDEDLPFTVEDVYQAAIQHAKEEYTQWYNSVVAQNKAGTKVVVEPQGITNGHLVQVRDEDGNVTWRPIEGNIKGVGFSKTIKYGPKQLEGGKIKQAPPGDADGRSVVKVGTTDVTLRAGDTILVLPNANNFVPLRARNVSDEEAQLIMYLMSLGVDQGFDASVDIPQGVYYEIGEGAKKRQVKNSVNVFGYTAEHGLQGFGLLHTIINYGRKQKQDKKQLPADKRKGEVFVGTNKQEIYYVDFKGKQQILKLPELKASVDSGKFATYSPEVKQFYDFLLEKRINVSRFFVEKNPLFLKPKLVKSKDGKYKVEFDTKGSYYDFLFKGDNPVLRTSAVNKPGYPAFANRNMYFNSKTTQGTKKPAAPKQESAKKPIDLNKVTSIVKTANGTEIYASAKNFDFKITFSGGLWSLNLKQNDGSYKPINPKTGVNLEATTQEQLIENASKNIPIELIRLVEKGEDISEYEKLLKPEKTTVVADSKLAQEVAETPDDDPLNVFAEANAKVTVETVNPTYQAPDLGNDPRQADKILTNEELLEYKIKTNEIIKECL